MKKALIIRYCEIHLKGKNRGFFERLLEKNIERALEGILHTFVKARGRYLVEDYAECDYPIIVEKLGKVFGIHTMSPALVVETTIENIRAAALSVAPTAGDFKVETKRADKKFFMDSMQICRDVGGFLLSKNKNLRVNVVNPSQTVQIDVREEGVTYVFSEFIKGAGGMPSGSSGSGLLLISGGIDSPVAVYMMAKRGVKISAVHFHSYPYTSNFAREKVEDLAKILTGFTGDMTIYMVSMTELQEEINAKCDDSYTITLLRRGMFTIAERLCKKYGKKMIVTGESLGQVASQTIESMTVVSEVVKETPIIRPLVAFDKCETIDIAKKIGTYETSIRPFEDCCTVFLPESPVVRPVLYKVLKEQNKLDFDAILDRAMESIEIVEIKAD